ncbi:MAG: AI-2E family transporter [Candidatus Gracilibacteria bacterium]
MASNFRQFIKNTHQKIKNLHGRVKNLRRKRDEGSLSKSIKLPRGEVCEKVEIKISTSTMARFVAITILLLLLTAFLYEIKDVLIMFFVALLFAAALDPMVDALQKRRIPRSVGVILIYIAVLVVLGLFISNLAPILSSEISQLAGRIQDFVSNIVSGKIELPKFMEGIRPAIKKFFDGVDISQIADYKEMLLNVANKLSDVAGNLFNSIIVVFNGFFNGIIVLVLTFLMTVDETGIDKFIQSLFPAKHATYIQQKSGAIKEKIGYWLRGQVALCIIIGVLVYIGLLIIGLFTGQKIEYAATIGLVAGITEFIPYAGPLIAWLIALPILANQSVVLIAWVTALMYIVQTLENNLIVPVVMNKAVGISPIFIMFAMFVGFQFLGVLGIILSVPVATAVAIFIKDYTDRDK